MADRRVCGRNISLGGDMPAPYSQDLRKRVIGAVAAGKSPDVVCALASEGAARLRGADGGGIIRFDAGDHITVIGTWTASGVSP